MNTDMKMNADVQRYVLQSMYASIMRVYITERFESIHDGKPDPEHAGEHTAAVMTPPELSMLALVCKLWNGELQLHLKKEVAAAVAHFMDVAPVQAIALVNVDMYTHADWMGLPSVTKMLFTVRLESREVFAIWVERSRVDDEDDEDDEDDPHVSEEHQLSVDPDMSEEHQLSVGCRVLKTTDDKSWFSHDMVIPVHKLCLVSGNDFTDADKQSYHAWHDATLAQMRAWLASEYAQMTAAAAV